MPGGSNGVLVVLRAQMFYGISCSVGFVCLLLIAVFAAAARRQIALHPFSAVGLLCLCGLLGHAVAIELVRTC